MNRHVHAGAWWLWALSLGVAGSLTTNPLLLMLMLSIIGLVVAACRQDTSLGRGFRIYVWLAVAVVMLRIVFRALLGGDFGSHELIDFPALTSPEWMGSFELGGSFTLEEALAGGYDGLRLGTILVCVGAANTLADPRRLLRLLPRSLGHLASSAVVALTVAPQLITVVGRVRRARQLRGERSDGWRGLRSLLVPVLEDTMSRSLALASSMESRGYGRVGSAAGSAGLALLSMGLFCVGAFAVLTSNRWGPVGAAVALAGLGGTLVTLRRLGRGSQVTRYRPEPWTTASTLVAVGGGCALASVALSAFTDAAVLAPSIEPLAFPSLMPGVVIGILLAATPTFFAMRGDETKWLSAPRASA